MKPLKLVMQAFGPYSQKESIDFYAMGENAIFLINGPTGAGKSTILDAMCFALYGQTSGKEREASEMRCDYAQENLITEVSFTFKLGNICYRIARQPTQLKLRARGEGTTKLNTNAQLWRCFDNQDDELIVAKSATEATQAVMELTGLNADQFRQVMVLPQGKFREFLLADSKQREHIFSQLFQTHIYKKIEERLKNQAAEIRNNAHDLEEQKRGIMQSFPEEAMHIGVDAYQAMLNDKLNEKRKEKTACHQVLQSTQKEVLEARLLDDAYRELEKLKARQQQLLVDKKTIDDKKEQLSKIQMAVAKKSVRSQCLVLKEQANEHRNHIQTLEKANRQVEQKLKSASDAFARVESELETIEPLKAKVLELNQLIPKLEEHERSSHMVAKYRKDYESQVKCRDTQREALTQKKHKVQDVESTIDKLESELKVYPALVKELAETHDLGKQWGQFEKFHKELASLTPLIEKQKTLLVSLDQRCVTSEKHYQTLELHWHRNQAAILAEKLQTNHPCLVCGSTFHPKPAQYRDDAVKVTKEAIDVAQRSFMEDQEKLNNEKIKLREYESQYSALEKPYKECQSLLGEYQENQPTHLRHQWKQLNARVKKLEAQLTEVELKKKNLQELKTTVQKEEVAFEKLSAEVETAYLSLKKEETIMQQLSKDIPSHLQDKKMLISQIDSLKQKISEIESRFIQCKQEKQTYHERNIQQCSQLAEKKSHLARVEEDYQQQWEAWNEHVKTLGFTDDADYIIWLNKENEAETIHESITSYEHEVSTIELSITEKEVKVAGKSKPELELLTHKEAQQSEAFNKSVSEFESIDAELRQLYTISKRISKVQNDIEQLNQQYSLVGTLSDAASGNTSQKISLQRFVLGVLLDDVLNEASHRLIRMSKGRYYLVRKEDKAKGNRASGLDLEVFDAYTGRARSVSTLSGGESFMAALSLALGLSEVVQSYSGGIRLDTLFIDEGFGSLDQEALDLAIKTLVDLQSVGRTIGIISHVSELKEQITDRIDIKMTRQGSHIHVVTQRLPA